MRALIIDDSLLLRKMVQKAVNTAIPAINQFEYAGDGIEAVQVLRSALRSKQKYDLIVTDTNMPKMSGLEFMEQIQKEKLCPTTHIIMITTENSPEHVARAKAAGSKGNISKPFTAEQVRAVLGPLFPGK
jgi:two-component system chemotaxis response regulator CheY